MLPRVWEWARERVFRLLLWRERRVWRAQADRMRARAGTPYRTPAGCPSLPQLCLDLVMAARGSGPPKTPLEMARALQYISRRLYHWTQPTPEHKGFDDAVRRLACAAVTEVESACDLALYQARRAGVGATLVEHEGGTLCLGCFGAWPGDTSRVGQRCGNLMCPDRMLEPMPEQPAVGGAS